MYDYAYILIEILILSMSFSQKAGSAEKVNIKMEFCFKKIRKCARFFTNDLYTILKCKKMCRSFNWPANSGGSGSLSSLLMYDVNE
jgi:hypothetical protein